MKLAKSEVGVALALTLTIAILSIFSSITPQRDNLTDYLSQSKVSLSGKSSSTFDSSERVQIMDANIQGKLKNGTFETVILSIEALTREKGGFIVTEDLTFKDDLWSGEIVSKLPPANASDFTIAARQEIGENGRVVLIQVSIHEFTRSQNATDSEYYSTIRTFLSEEFEEGKETPEPIIQLQSVLPILVTGLVWVAEGLIVGVPLCFASLGVVVLVKRVIIPLWKKELSKPV